MGPVTVSACMYMMGDCCGFRFHRTDRGETAASLRTGQRLNT